MDRDPGDIESYLPSKAVAEMSDDEFDAWMASLPPAPGIRHVDDEDPEDDARAEADIAAGRVYPHEIVKEWLKTWGSPEYRPFHEWFAMQNG